MLSHIQKYDILLASNSPRRRELLSGLGIEYQVTALPNIDESYPETLQGEEIPQYIATVKAEAYKPEMSDKTLLITADYRCLHHYTGKTNFFCCFYRCIICNSR